MAEEDKDKTAFYVGEGVFCYKKISFGLKNAGGTYQRLVDKVFSHQIGRNLEAYVDDMVIKSTFEKEMLKDIQETFECAERSLAFFKALKGCKDKKSIQWTIKADKALEKMKKLVQTLPTLTAPRVGETLTMHLVASKGSISVVLAAKRNDGWTAHLFRRNEKETPADFLVEIPLEDNDKKEKLKEVLDSSSKWRLYTDGASNSDGSEPQLMLIDLEGKEYTYALHFEFETTNNEAEYEALLAGLRIAQEMEIKKVAIFLDSQLLVIQIKGTFIAKHTSIKDYLQKVKNMLRGFKEYTVEHVRRNQNKKEDALSKLTSMTFKHLTKEVLVEVLTKRSIEEKEVLKVDTQERKSWMDPIHEYMLSRLLPEDIKEARKIKI
nr:reverse transcriptase domain-containing protein [Tanacetum cinerariifolium]